jgi:diguanylate cyclase (GGDEF)-like protein
MWQAWALFSVPLVVAMPLSGPRGLALAGAATALVFGLLAGDPQISGSELVVGFASFTITGAALGVAQRARERRLEHVERHSVTDRLTGLPNFAFFTDALTRECRRSDRYELPLSLILLDLDRYKAFNDHHGHEAGNRFLAEVGVAIRECLRGSDLAARYGGEELAIIVQGSASDAVEVAERVRARVAEIRVPVPGGRKAGTTVSAGVAEYVHATGSGDLMLDQADKALYAAKDAGRDQVRVFEPEHRWARTGVA